MKLIIRGERLNGGARRLKIGDYVVHTGFVCLEVGLALLFLQSLSLVTKNFRAFQSPISDLHCPFCSSIPTLNEAPKMQFVKKENIMFFIEAMREYVALFLSLCQKCLLHFFAAFC